MIDLSVWWKQGDAQKKWKDSIVKDPPINDIYEIEEDIILEVFRILSQHLELWFIKNYYFFMGQIIDVGICWHF